MSSDTTESTSTPPQIFPLAHPPPKSPQCLRLSSRLVLQLQQLAPSGRPVPVLEVFQPSRLGRTFSHGRGPRVKLSPHDLYLTQSEPFAHLPVVAETTRPDREIVGAICTLPFARTKQKQKQKQQEKGRENEEISHGDLATALLYFPSASGSEELLTWEACRTSRGYRFRRRKASVEVHVQGETDTVVLDWEKRPRTRASDEDHDKGDRFVLTIVAETQPDLRRPWLATLTKKGLKVGGWERSQVEFLAEEEGLYTWALTMGVYVAEQEGWI